MSASAPLLEQTIEADDPVPSEQLPPNANEPPRERVVLTPGTRALDRLATNHNDAESGVTTRRDRSSDV